MLAFLHGSDCNTLNILEAEPNSPNYTSKQGPKQQDCNAGLPPLVPDLLSCVAIQLLMRSIPDSPGRDGMGSEPLAANPASLRATVTCTTPHWR